MLGSRVAGANGALPVVCEGSVAVALAGGEEGGEVEALEVVASAAADGGGAHFGAEGVGDGDCEGGVEEEEVVVVQRCGFEFVDDGLLGGGGGEAVVC